MLVVEQITPVKLMINVSETYFTKVKKGEPLMELDLAYLKAHAPSITSPILCTELEDNQKIRLLKEGHIQAGEGLFAIDLYE